MNWWSWWRKGTLSCGHCTLRRHCEDVGMVSRGIAPGSSPACGCLQYQLGRSQGVGMGDIIEITGDDYHVLKYHDI